MNLKYNGKITPITTACLLCLGLGTMDASAESLLLDFGQTNVAAPYLTTDPGHAAATVAGTDTSWNTIKTSSATSSLLYGNGSAAAGITLTMGQEASPGNNVISYSTAIANLNLAGTGGSVAGQQKLLTSGSVYGDDNSSTAVGRDAFFGGGTATVGAAAGLRIDGLAAGDYLVYVMARNCNSDATSLPMNIFSFVGAPVGTFDFSALTGISEANTGYLSTSYTGQYSTFQDGENYVGLNITIGSGDSLFLAADGASATETRGFLNMVEIVSVPEPATGAMFGMGILTLALAFKKRQTV